MQEKELLLREGMRILGLQVSKGEVGCGRQLEWRWGQEEGESEVVLECEQLLLLPLLTGGHVPVPGGGLRLSKHTQGWARRGGDGVGCTPRWPASPAA